MQPDYYAVLGLDRDAGAETIRATYRTLAQRFHPDRNHGDARATARFKALTEAYTVLGDADRRAAYDAGAIPEGLTVEPGSSLAEAVGGLVDRLFGIRDTRPTDGRNRRYRLTVGFVEAMNGAPQTITLPSDTPCDACDGRGFPAGTIPLVCTRCGGAGEVVHRPFIRAARTSCDACDGRGFTAQTVCGDCDGSGGDGRERTLTIDVPVGADDGQTLRIRGAGEPGRHGGRDGDCLVSLQVTPHPRLARDGQDIVCDLPVTVFEAVLGGEIPLPTLRGPRAIRLPAGVADQSVLRMAGYGVDAAHDQRVRVQIDMPKALTTEQRAQLAALAEDAGTDPFPAVAATRPEETS